MGETPRRGQSLAELVTERMYQLGDVNGPLSLRQVVDRSGERLSAETVRRIARGDHQGDVSERVAQGLAMALEVPLPRIYEAAGRPRPLTRWEWPTKFDRLSLKQRRLVESVADGFLQAYQQGREEAEARLQARP